LLEEGQRYNRFTPDMDLQNKPKTMTISSMFVYPYTTDINAFENV